MSVKEIVDAHGWIITITESADGGAQFDIREVDSSTKGSFSAHTGPSARGSDTSSST